MERTLAILKPDSAAAGKAGAMIAKLQEEGFVVPGDQDAAVDGSAGPGVL